jgi:hypothetical protein
MTKTIDYSKTIIYKLVCNDLNITDVYVGHTTNFLKRRTSHKNVCNDEKDKRHNLKVYRMIRQNGGWVNWTMVEVEKFSCSDKNEATKKERYYYELLNSTLNSITPIQTKEEANQKKKIHYKNNKEAISQRRKIEYKKRKIIKLVVSLYYLIKNNNKTEMLY